VVVAKPHRAGYKVQTIFIQVVKLSVLFFLKIVPDVVTFEDCGREITEHTSS
jgi:hypothetical protein